MPPTSSPRYSSSGRPSRGRTAPLGIKLYCILMVLVSLYGALLSIRIVAGGGPFFVLGLLLLSLMVGHLAVAYGLWTLRPWGWTWGMVLFAINVVLSIFELDILSVIIGLLLLAYLYSKRSYYR